MKLNNKGFAVSSLLYSILVLFLGIVVVIIMLLASSKFTYDKVKSNVTSYLNAVTSNEAMTYEMGDLVYYDPVRGKVCDYLTSYDYLNTGTCYTWYVIENSNYTDAKVNLMLNRNLGNAVAWQTDTTNRNKLGPTTVLTYLNTLTTSWVTSLNGYRYVDEGYTVSSGAVGYQRITINNGVATIKQNNGANVDVPGVTKARLITKEEFEALGCVLNTNYSCPYYAYENLYDGVIYGYWSLSSTNSGDINSAWYTRYEAGLYTRNATRVDNNVGVRPVIEVNKRDLLTCNNDGICAYTNPEKPIYINSNSTSNRISATYDISNIDNATYYTCYYGKNKNSTKTIGAYQDGECLFKYLNPNETYYFMLCTTNAEDKSSCSDIKSKQTLPIVYEYNYTGDSQSFTASNTGKYKIELWGAQGGNSGGEGAYTSGEIYLNSGETLGVYVGGAGGATGTTQGGYNGGGNSVTATSSSGATGGGATDVRYGGNTVNSRIMVAGGGGGFVYEGHGGGLTGYDGFLTSHQYYAHSGKGGTQLAGGALPVQHSCGTTLSTVGTFGYGGIGGANALTAEAGGGAGGGGGYYGGSGGSGICNESIPAGGGSSFISGHTGSIAIVSASNTAARTGTNGATCSSNTLDNLCSLHYSSKSFTNTVMIDGVGYSWSNVKGALKRMPKPEGGYYILGEGHAGNGYARITYIDETERVNTALDDVRYIKDCINGTTTGSPYSHWVEVQAIYNGENLAYGKAVISSDVSSPSYVTDGSINSNPYTTANGTGNQCVVIDLGKKYDLDEIGIWHYWADNRTYNDNVMYVSNDNKKWQTIYSYREIETANGKRVSAYEKTNLVENGYLEDKSNNNFSIYTYHKDGYLYFTAASYTVGSDGLIPIDPDRTYQISYSVKSDSADARPIYGGVLEYDVDGNIITATNTMYVPNTLTTLAQTLKNGDGVVYLTSTTDFNNSGAPYYQRGLIFWNYVDSTGYTYPPLTYSRNAFVGYNPFYDDNDINKTNHTITLNAPWSGGTFPKGTEVSQSSSGGTYNYSLIAGGALNTTWTHYYANITGTSINNNSTRFFRPGTRYIKPFIISSSTPRTIYIKDIGVKVIR